MLTTRPSEKVLGYLGRALSFEWSAVQQYSTQARLVASWGLSEAAESFQKEVTEELKHAQSIIERMLAVGVMPNASQLRPVQLGQDLSALLKGNLAFEAEIVDLYRSAAEFCAANGDHDSRLFFEGLLDEERQHHATLLDWYQRIQKTS